MFSTTVVLMLAATCATGCAPLHRLEAAALIGPLPGHTTDEPGQPLEVVAGDGVHLHGFVLRGNAFSRTGARSRGVAVFFHGQGEQATRFADAAVAFAEAGFDVVAWDSRGHGASGGYVTYGALERHDLGAVLDALGKKGLPVDRVLLFGYSMGAALAIEAAACEPRVRAVVAVAPFATLDGVVRRVTWAAPERARAHMVRQAEAIAGFRVGDVRPVDDAARLTVPLLLVAGDADRVAPLREVAAIAAAAGAHAHLLIVTGADHQSVMRECGPPCQQALETLLVAARL